MASILDVPSVDVIFPEVFSLLKISDLWRCRRVCNSFKLLVEGYFQYCRQADWSKDSDIVTESAFLKVMSRAVCLTALNVDKLDDNFTEASLQLVLDNDNKNVRYVSMRQCRRVPPWLTARFLSNNRQLRHIDLGLMGSVSPAVCVSLSQACPDLLYLNLEGASLVDDTCVTCIAMHCRKLQHCAIPGCYKISDDGIFELTRNLKELAVLNICNCFRISNVGVRFVSQFSSKLRSLLVAGCSLVTEESLATLRHRQISLDVVGPGGQGADLGYVKRLAFLQV